MMVNREKKYLTWVYGALIIFLVYLLFIFPLTGDDFNRLAAWDGGIEGVWDQFSKTYQDLNGRLAGNFLSFFMIIRPVRVLFKALSFLGLVYLTYKIFPSPFSPLFMVFGLVFAPIEVFREVVVWNAGFFNYLPPLVLILASLYIFKREERGSFEEVLAFGLAFIGALFVENLSIYLIFMPILAFFIFRTRNIFKYLASLLGSILANLVMFSSPVYSSISQGGDDYRTLNLEDLGLSLEEIWPVFEDLMVPLVIGGLVFLALAYLIYKDPRDKLNYVALAFLGLIYISKDLGLAYGFSMAVHIGFYICLILILRKLGGYWREGVFACLSLALAMGPLILVSPVGPRNFITALVFNLVIVLALVLSLNLEPRPRLVGARVLILLTLIRLVVFGVCYTQTYSVHQDMLEGIKWATLNERKTAKVQAYPYPEMVHREDGKKIALMYQERYGTPKPVDVVFE